MQLLQPGKLQSTLLALFSVFAFSFLSLNAAQSAEEEANPIGEVFGAIMDGEGHLTEAMHTRFWAALLEAVGNDQAEVDTFWNIMRAGEAFTDAKYLNEASKSSKLSLDAGEIIKTPGYEPAWEAYYNAKKETASHDELMELKAKWDANIVQFSKRDLSNKDAIRNAHYVLEEQSSLSAGSLYRFETLANPQYAPSVVKRNFLTVPVTVSWPGAFFSSFQTQQRLEVGLLSHLVNGNALLKIVHYRMGKLNASNLEAIMTQIGSGTLAEQNVKDGKTRAETWNDMPSVVSEGIGSTNDLKAEVSLRVIPSPDGNGLIMIHALAFADAAQAGVLRQQLEAGLQF